MIPTVLFCGYSGSGKTTLVSKVIEELSAKGYKVASIKHEGHGEPLKYEANADSALHKRAGAVCSIVSNRNGYMVNCDTGRDLPVAELASMVPASVDIIIGEGFKGEKDIPKIEVYRADNGKERACKGDSDLIAVVSDCVLKDENIPAFDINDTAAITSFLEENFLKERPSISLYLVVNGQPVPTKDFILEMLTHSIHGLIKPLKGCDNPKEILIKAVYD